MRVMTLVAPVFGANCFVLSPSAGGPCVIVDPGGGVAGAVREYVASEGLEPVAVLATHGHVDHTWSAAELTQEYGVDLHIHSADAYRLADPFGTLEPRAAGLVSGTLGSALAASGCAPGQYREPGRVVTFGEQTPDDAAGEGSGRTADVVLDWAGIEVRAVHAPGHTQGSTLYVLGEALGNDSVLPQASPAGLGGSSGFALTGDVLFAGTIGRTDLPGGDGHVMGRTLREVVGALDDHLAVLPGHGPASRMDHEKRTNPFLARR